MFLCSNENQGWRCGEDAAVTDQFLPPVLLLWKDLRVSSPAGLSRTATDKLIGNIDNIVTMTDVKINFYKNNLEKKRKAYLFSIFSTFI